MATVKSEKADVSSVSTSSELILVNFDVTHGDRFLETCDFFVT